MLKLGGVRLVTSSATGRDLSRFVGRWKLGRSVGRKTGRQDAALHDRRDARRYEAVAFRRISAWARVSSSIVRALLRTGVSCFWFRVHGQELTAFPKAKG